MAKLTHLSSFVLAVCVVSRALSRWTLHRQPRLALRTQRRSDLPGYNVIFQPFTDDEVGETFEEFATGFAGDERPLPDEALHRPVGVAVGPDGSLYISDDQGGRVWRVIYMGSDEPADGGASDAGSDASTDAAVDAGADAAADDAG